MGDKLTGERQSGRQIQEDGVIDKEKGKVKTQTTERNILDRLGNRG